MTPSGLRILQIFKELDRERLDLHALFESAGNEPESRNAVLNTVDELVREGLLESCGGDFYSLTDNAKRLVSRGSSSATVK